MSYFRKGLKPIVHMVSNKDTHEHEIVAIVRNSSNLNSFKDLKNHKACFANFRDAGKDKIENYF